MPTAISKKSIAYENNHEAIAVFPPAGAKAEDIIAALDITGFKAVLLVIGGADSVDEKLKSRLTQLFSRGVARAAATMNAVIIDGGTEAGVMAMMGQGVADRGFKSALVGVAPLAMVSYPGSEGKGETPLDPNHSHFVLVEGKAWGSETNVIFKLVRALRSSKAPVVVLLAGGGAITKNEALQAVRQNLPLFIVEGSGGTADEIAAAWKAKPELPDDPVMAEIIADGKIEFHLLANSVKGAERLIIRELRGDQVLQQAWENFADYDLNAILQQQRFERVQRSILAIGILATTLAVSKEVFAPKDANGSVIARWSFWWFVQYLLITIPIILTILITAANRFKQGNKWLLLRAGAESIKREIYRYRARAGDYSGLAKPTPETPQAVATPESLISPPQPPPPSPAQVLSQRVEDITRRIMRTEVNTSALKPYDKNKGFPPYMYAAEGGDDGFSLLSPDRYVEVRLGDQLRYYKKTALRLERQLKFFQYTIFIVGGLGTFLAAINKQVWIALTTAVAGAVTTYLGYRQTESSLTKYNQAATDLANVKAWWMALPPEEQAKQDNVTTLVDHTEQVLQSELDGWVQQIQNALAELRKGQEKAPEKEESRGGDGSSQPQTDEEKAAAAQTAGDQLVGEGETTTDDPTSDEQAATDEQTADDQIVGEGETGEPTTDEQTVTNEPTTTDEETTDEPKPPGR